MTDRCSRRGEGSASDEPHVEPRAPRARPKGAAEATERDQQRGYAPLMSKRLLERRLADVAERLKQLRAELTVTAEQLTSLEDDAADARLRALVSETPLAEREHHEAQRHADAMLRHRAEVQSSIEQLERRQDELLDRLVAEIS
ncbi:MAG: hypothetical protein QOJ67_857 [Acidimicrobiaceae bacterium]